MNYRDRVYGKIEISEPLFLELIKTPSLQRLKKIDQIGYFEPHFPGTAHSRFEHSLGVYILLRKYNAPIEEQIAGLIHDVSHSVFSHCIDYALDSGSEQEHSHQDNIFEDYVRKSEIPLIFNKYKVDMDYILNENNFPLKEKSLPGLCADRIDYSLRTGVIFNDINQDEVGDFLNNLVVKDNYWVFKNFETAKKYADLFCKLNSFYYSGLPSAVMFRTVGDCLRYALQKKYVIKEDLYTTDEQVLQKIKDNLGRDKKLKLFFDRMNNKIRAENNLKDYNTHVFCKSRVVDPLFMEAGRVKRVSEVDREYKNILEEELIPKKYFLRFEK